MEFATSVRGNIGIENGLTLVLDVAFRVDRSRSLEMHARTIGRYSDEWASCYRCGRRGKVEG